MKKTFSIKVIILSLLTSILGGGLGGCIKKDNIFSRLNNQSIIIPTSDQRWGRWISTNIKTEPNIHNQLFYLESCISKQFHLNLKKGQHIPFELKNEMQYLDPNPKKKNEIKLLSNGKKGSFYVTWAYTPDQQKIFNLYRKLQSIPVDNIMSIKGEGATGFDPKKPKPINLSKYIQQIRNIIKKSAPSITDDEKSMINFSGTSDLKLQFDAVQDIFPKLCLSKNKTKYNFQKDCVLGKNMIKPVIKLKWYNLPIIALFLREEILHSTYFDWWFDSFVFYIDRFHYADENSFITVVCHELELVFPALTPDLYKYFSLSHTELFVEKPVPITLFFNEGNKYPELGISFQRTIYGKGEVLPDEKNI